MDYKTVSDKLNAAQKLLESSTLTHEQFGSVKTILKGISPKLDKLLSHADKELSKLTKLHTGDVLSLTVEALPEHTEKDKKRKKLLLLFLQFWTDIKAEVTRIQKEVNTYEGKSDHSFRAKTSTASRIIAAAKGPLGAITAIAVIAVVLQTTAVSIVIKNQGCGTLDPTLSVAVKLPGVNLPNESVPDGGQTTVTMPPLPITVDGTDTIFRVQVVGYTITFDLSGERTDLIFDGVSLLGKRTSLPLSQQKSHELIIRCGR